MPGQDAEDPVDYSVLFAYTSVPYYQEVGWENASGSSISDDDTRVERELAPEVVRLAERELGPQAVRLRVVAAERSPRAAIVEDQVEEKDAEWNAMAIANIAGAENFEADIFDINDLYASEGEGYVYSDDEGDGENQNNNEMIE